MLKRELKQTEKLTISAMMIALYIVVLYTTQSFSFGAYQIRIATSLYAMGYFFPFLTLPMGIANALGNILMGGLGPIDMIGGGLVGVLVTGCCAYIGSKKGSPWWVILPITFGPGLLVSIWLSALLHIPYAAMAANLCVGQAVAAVCGVLLVKLVKRYGMHKGSVVSNI